MPLSSNIDWSNIGCITLYCEEFYADLGHLEFEATTSSPITTEPEPTPMAPPEPQKTHTSIDDLQSCTELIPGYLNAHWELINDGSTLLLGLEGRPGGDNRWLGFGFSSPSATSPNMVGSNVIVAGMVKGKCFAYNYFLSSQSQCDFSTADGVCPNFAGQPGTLVPSTDVDLMKCEKVGDKLTMLMSRPLAASAGKDNAWPIDGSRYSIYAMGPVSEGSNSIPVVLYHNLQLPGKDISSSVTATSENPVKLNFSATGKNCRQIVAGATTGDSGAPSPPPKKSTSSVVTLDGPTNFTVTIGTNANYPNPPAWGLSLWVNEHESPVLVVRRGETYTFQIEAGPSHPIYVTDSIVGGGLLVDYESETIFAGGDDISGTAAKPGFFKWTPDAKTPDLVYYQCTVHQKLGWEIRVQDAGTAAAAPVPEVEMMVGPFLSSPSPASSVAPSPAPEEAINPADRCSITVSGVAATYDACFPVEGVGNNFNLAWSLKSDTADTSSSILTMALSASIPANGYVAVGFPDKPGFMIGSTAMVLQACASCPSGAQLIEYFLGGQVQSAVTPSNTLGATNLKASLTDGNFLSGTFQVKLPASSATSPPLRRRRLILAVPSALEAPVSDFPLIYSAGVLSSTGLLQFHSSYGSSTVDLGVSSTPAEGGGPAPLPPTISTGSSNPTARTAHMWLMVIGFGILIPIGVLVARLFPPPQNATGFKVHTGLQVLGFLLGCGGLAAGFVAGGGWSSKYQVHRNIGVAVIVLCFVQISALVLRPAPDAKFRKPWAFGHRWIGRAVAVLAIANIYYGIIHVAVLGTWAWATYTAILVVILAIAIGKEATTSSSRCHENTTNAKALDPLIDHPEFIVDGQIGSGN